VTILVHHVKREQTDALHQRRIPTAINWNATGDRNEMFPI